MFDHWLRMLKDRILEPIAPAIGRWVHPNLISLLALLVGLAAALLAAQGRQGPAFAAWVVNRTLDGLDGSVARAAGTVGSRRPAAHRLPGSGLQKQNRRRGWRGRRARSCSAPSG